MVNWKTIDELRQNFIERYTTAKFIAELEKACSEEHEWMRDYNGRQILELLQNVDDACNDYDKNESVVYIKYVDNILEVGNTGTTFTKETIERLCFGRSSNKSLDNIGNKGTGFRSLLNDAEWIEIHSGEFSIKFSHKYAKKLFDEYINKESENYSELINNQLINWKKDYDLCFPILHCPEIIERVDSEFSTLIRVKIKETNSVKTSSIDNQLNMPFYKSILFLPNITKIVIETKDSTRQYEKCVDSKETYDDVLIEDNMDNIEHYYLFKKHVKILKEKSADLIIAYPIGSNDDITKENLYCYFPIRNFQTPIHALIHAPFLTNSSRDDVPNDNEQINYTIFKEVAIFIKEVAEKLIDLNGTNPIEFVTPINFLFNKMWDMSFFNLKDTYLELLCNSKIIPTVNNEFISINDGPKILEINYPDEFKGEGFDKLVKKISNQNVYSFIKEMCSNKSLSYNFESNELSNAINLHKDEYDIDSSVRIFCWWSKNYRTSNIMPKLLKDTNDNWIQNDFKVFLPTNDGISMLDDTLNWVKLCVLKQEYVTKLIEVIKKSNSYDWEKIASKYTADRTNEKRLLDAYSDFYLAVGFTEQSSSRVIVSEIINQVDSIEKSILFMDWFFKNYKDKMTSDSELAKLKFKLPDRNDTLQDTKNLYFGGEYGNSLADKVFRDTTYYPLCRLDKIYNGEEKQEFIEFIKSCGVLTYPKYKKITLKDIDESFYFKWYVKEKYDLKININYLETYSVDNFQKLLLELTTKEIVELLSKDLSLSSLILSTEKQSSVKQQINWSPTCFNSNEYVLFILNNTKWIEIENKKYSPKDIIKYGKLKNKLDSIYGIQEKELISLLNEDIVKRYNLEFKENFSDFSDKQIEDILKKLPTFDTGEISRKLYIDIIKYKRDQEPNYKVDGIKLIAKDGKYHLNNELIYVDKSIPQKIDNGKKIDIPIQQNTETIRKWFGVKKVEINLRLTKYTSIDDFTEFVVEFKDLKTCVLSMLDDTSNYISKLQRMKIIPCQEINAIDSVSSCSVEMNDYAFIKKDGSFYYKLPTKDMATIRTSHEYAMAFIEMFKEAISPQIPMDLLELLIGKNHQEKRFKIDEKYGIDKWNTSYELLFERSNLSKMIEDFFRNNGLEGELLKKISEIDYSSELIDEDFKVLFLCLENINKDIRDLNNIHETIKIDASDYIKKQCVNYLNSYRNAYRTSCYSFLARTPNKQFKYLSMINDFDDYDFYDSKINNSIHYSAKDLIKAKFPLFDSDVKNLIDVDDIYNKNYTMCINAEGVIQSDFDYFIEGNKEKRSLLYFDSCESLIQEFLSLKEDNDEFLPNDETSVIDENETSTIVTELITSTPIAGGKEKTRHNGEFGKKKSKELNDRNELAGKNAENIAYIELKKSYPNLIWNSKYTKIPADKNNQPPNNIVCDMWNHSNDGNTYFEVKSFITEFEMSINEYESMKNNKTNYYVVLVNRDTKEISMHLFDELDSFKEPSKYKFIFRQKLV